MRNNPDLGVDETALDRWAADARVSDAAEQRARQHWMRHQLFEESSLRGVLLDYAEQRAMVTLQCVDGRRLTGAVQTVGIDFAELCGDDDAAADAATLVALASVRSITARAGEPTGEREPALDQSLRDVLFSWSEHRPDIVVRLAGVADPATGQLRSVGADLFTLRESATERSTVHVPIAHVVSVTRR